jgi:ATP-binding cassette, subfamily B, multidrug efflux pump
VNSFQVLKRMMVYLRPYRAWAMIALFSVVSSTALSILIPGILRDVVDIGIASADSGFMVSAGLLVVGLGVLRGLTGFLFRYFGERQSHHIAFDIRNQIYDKVQNQSFTFQDNSQTGTLITRAISDVAEMQRFFAYGLIDGLSTGLLLVGVALIMVISNPLLALIALLPLIPLAYFSYHFAGSVDPAWKKIMDRMQTLGNHIQETALGAEVVRAFAREEYEIKKFANNNEQLFHEQVALVNRWGNYIPLSTFIIAFSTALVLFFGGLMEQAGAPGVTVGTVVAFNAYVLMLAMPIRFLGFVILLITQAISSGRRVFDVLDEPELITNRADARPLPEMHGHVQFQDVSIVYENARHPSIKHITLDARPGEIIALVGPTGSGKSTLVNLIPRFYDVTDGRVCVDGVDVRELDLHDLRRQIGVVLQQSLLFSATMRENIAYGRPDATEETIIAAAKAANAHDFIMEFPEGYDTLIGERGVTLSGGQRQRVAIARALLIDPRILILDDSTSSVDTRTEQLIREALERIMQGRTTFLIAQRLNSVQKADQILVLKDGEIVERGKHADLLALNGHYAEIYRLQLADQERARRELADFSRLQPDVRRDKSATDEYRAVRDQISGD